MAGIQSLVRKPRKPRVPQYAAGGIPALVKKARVPKYADGGTTATSYTTNVPGFAEQPYRDLVATAADFAQTPYQPYQGDRIATFNPLQEQGFEGVQNLAPTGQSTAAGTMAQTAGDKALAAGTYDPTKFTSTMPGGPQMTSTQSFNAPGTAGAYMDPYMQGVVDIAKREATRNDDIARTQRNAAAVGAGAFGGSRQAIVESEAGRNLQQHLGDIQQQGSDAAFKAAQAQFNTEQTLGLQSQTTNQNAGLTFNQQDLDKQKAEEMSKEFGSTIGVQGANAASTAASTLGGIGSDIYKQGQNAAVTQVGVGGGQQTQAQGVLDQQYQDFINQQNDPAQKMSFLSNILHGTQGTTQSSTTTPAQPSNLQTLAGLGTLLYGASGLAAGGSVKRSSAIDRGLARIAPQNVGEFAEGGIVPHFDGGGMPDWSEFDTPPPKRSMGPIKPRALPPGVAAGAAATPSAEAVAAAEAEAAMRAGLPYKVGNLAGRATRVLGPVGVAASTLHTVANPWNPDSSINTDTEDYAKRFGITPSNTALGDVGIRTAGVADDLLFHLPSAIFGPKKAGAKPAPAAPAAEPDAIDTGTATKDTASGRTGGGGGIGSLARIVVPPAPTMDQMRADRSAAGVDYDKFKAEGVKSRQDIGAAEEADAAATAKDTQDRIAAAGLVGDERQKKLQGRLDEMDTRGQKAKSDALITAGLAMLTAPTGGAGWRGAIAPIAAGAKQGIGQLRVDQETLRAQKDKLDDSMDALTEARRQESIANSKDLSAAQHGVRAARTNAMKDMNTFMGSVGLAQLKSNDELFTGYEKLQGDQRTNQVHADIAYTGDLAHLAAAHVMADSRASTAGGAGNKMLQPGTPAYEKAVIAEAAALAKSGVITDADGNPVMDPIARRNLIRQQAEVNIQRRGPAINPAAWSSTKLAS